MSSGVPAEAGTDDETMWRAKPRYWKACGLLLLVVAVVVPLFQMGDGAEGAVGMVLLVVSLVIWMFRVAAWEEDESLVVRNFFRTKRVPWAEIDKVGLGHTRLGTTWAYGVVRHGGRTTHVKALIIFRRGGTDWFEPARVVGEIRDLACRRNLVFDESSVEKILEPIAFNNLNNSSQGG